MAKFKVGPTGNLLQGHLYDVNRYSFEQTAKDYDRQLYLKWNPDKRRGLGCWELRRRPDKNSLVYQGQVEGGALFTMEPVENDLIHHVMDIPFLSYSYIQKLKDMDTWNTKNWVDELEYNEKKEQERLAAAYKSEMRYNLRQSRSIFKTFQEMVASGVNPALIAQHWK